MNSYEKSNEKLIFVSHSKFSFETKLLFLERKSIKIALYGIGHNRYRSSKFLESLATTYFHHRRAKIKQTCICKIEQVLHRISKLWKGSKELSYCNCRTSLVMSSLQYRIRRLRRLHSVDIYDNSNKKFMCC